MWQTTNDNGILHASDYPPYEPDSRGYGAVCFSKMKEFKDRVAQITTETNETQTYADLLRDCVRCALEMKSLGITENDIISLCTDTHSQTCIPFYAATFLGAKVASLDPTLALNDLKYLTNLVKPKLIFCIPQSVEMLEQALKETNQNYKLVVFGETDKHLPFKNFLRSKADEKDFKPKIADDIFDTAFILFSSGTTGLPKAVCVTHYGILFILNLTLDFFDATTLIFYTSPYWVSYIILTTSALLAGGKRIIAGNFDDHKFVKAIQDYKVTNTFVPPTFTYPVVNNPKNYGYDTSSLKTMLVGGSTISADQIIKIKKIFPSTIISQLYGSTELTAFFSAFHTKYDIDLINAKLGSCGKMVPGTSCKIIDFETNELVNGPFKRGELLVKTKRIMKEYYLNEKATKEAFDEDGFIHTGDVVYYDEDYCFYVVDRIKEMFKYKSWHIVPAELEAILLKHPSLKEGLIIGYPDEEDGDRPMAVVIPKLDSNITENDILEYFNAQVADRKKLRAGVKFVQNLPKTTTGKYSRRALRQMVINNEI